MEPALIEGYSGRREHVFGAILLNEENGRFNTKLHGPILHPAIV